MIELLQNMEVSDFEISQLLDEVYVLGGYTDPDVAKTLFKPSLVRQRGLLIGFRESSTGEFSGMVILVPSDSAACQFAKHNEFELQLLGVKEKYRGLKIGKKLVEESISVVKARNGSKIILWTQEAMKPAQNLYRSLGFSHISNFSKGGRNFLLHELMM